MKKSITYLLLLLFIPLSSLFSRQYDIDYFMECLESKNPETLKNYFNSHPNLISKTKHLVEFIELVRTNVEEKYGHSPSWEELYNQFKKVTPNLSLPKYNTREIKELLKTISNKTKSLEFGSCRVSALSFDYKGEVNFDEEQEQPVIATTEAIVGVLLMLIDTPYTRGAGAFLLSDAASKYKDYWIQQKSDDNKALRLEQDRAENGYYEPESHSRQSDLYDRSFDSEIR